MLITGGDLDDDVIVASECWDRDQRRVFYADSVGLAATEGDEDACAFGLELPEL